MNTEQYYIDLYNSNRTALEDTHPLLHKLREDSIYKFEQVGFPGKHLENYKYTSTARLFEPLLNVDYLNAPSQVELEEDFHCDIYNIDSYEVFVANGWWRAHKHELPNGVILCGIREAALNFPQLLSKYYHKQAQNSNDGLVHLNTAMALEGLFLYVPKHVELDKPIQLINVYRSEVDMLVNQRNLIIIEEGAKAKVLVRDHSLSRVNVVANVVNEIYVHARAQFDIYAIQYVHNNTSLLTHTYVTQEEESEVITNNITMHGGTVRNNTYVSLEGEHANNHVYGLGLPQGKQHVDNYCKIDHAKAHCSSYELFKNILDDESTAAFCGHILVREGAQKTDAKQNNKNICLTKLSHVYTQPQLEIYADDVKCSHGATVGQLDELAIFFLRSRGIPLKEAQMLLLSAFTHEAIESVHIEGLKDQLHELIKKRFRGELTRCYNCPKCKVLSN